MIISLRNVIFLLVLLLPFYSLGVDKLDSLKQQLEQTEGYEKMKVYFHLSKYYGKDDSEKCIHYNQEALNLAINSGDSQFLKYALTNSVKVHYQLAYYDKAIEFAEEYLDLCIDLKDSVEIAKAYNNLGVLNKNVRNFESALNYFNQSVILKSLQNDKGGLSKTYNNIGQIYKVLGANERAVDYYLKSLAIKEHLSDSFGIVNTLINIGISYDQIGLDSLAVDFLIRAQHIGDQIGFGRGVAAAFSSLGKTFEERSDYDQAIKFYLKSMGLNEQFGYQIDLARNYNSLGRAYLNVDKIPKATLYQDKAIAIAREVHDYNDLAGFLADKALLYIRQNKLNAAQTLLDECEALCDKHQLKAKQIIMYNAFSELHLVKGDYKKVYAYHLLAEQISDTLYSKEAAQKVANLQIVYNVEKNVQGLKRERFSQEQKLQQLTEQGAERELQLKKTKRYNYSLLINLLAFLIVLIILIISNIRARKSRLVLKTQKDEQVKQNELLNALINTIPSPLYFKSVDGKYEKCNDSFVEVIGLDREQIIGETLLEILPEQDRLLHKKSDEIALKGKELVKYEATIVSMKNKVSTMLIHKSSFLDQHGKPAGVIGVMVDISDRKKALDEIEEIGHRLSTLNDINKSLHLPYVAFLKEAMHGLSKHTHSEKSFFLNVNNEKETCELMAFYLFGENQLIDVESPTLLFEDCIIIKRILVKTETQIIEWSDLELMDLPLYNTYLKDKDLLVVPIMQGDELVSVFCTELPIAEYYSNFSIVSFFVSEVWGIIERKIQSEEVEKNQQLLTEANVSKDKFFSIIAHDLKNPFHGILGFANLLQEYYSDLTDEERLQYINNLFEATNSTYKLLENLLQWANAQTGRLGFKPEFIDLHVFGNECYLVTKSLADKKSIRINVDVEFNSIVYADPDMTRTILRNLTTNAIKFTNRRGEITIKAELKGEFYQVSVKDNGVGMVQSDIDKLFKIGEKIKHKGTEDEKGTGIGLNLCKEFVDQHGGEIWAESENGQGSTFFFTLPVDKTSVEVV